MLITTRFVFLHVPKTGGDFIRHICERHLPADWLIPTEITKHGGDTEIPEEHRHLPRFSLVRNPWDWHVSWYHYLIGSGRPDEHRDRVREANPWFVDLSAEFTLDFPTTMRRLYLPSAEEAAERQGILRAVSDQGVDILTHHLRNMVGASRDEGHLTMGRFESLREDFLDFLVSTGVPVSDEFRTDLLERPPVNRSSRTRFQVYYDEETRELIGRMAAETIARYGYSFEDSTPRSGEAGTAEIAAPAGAPPIRVAEPAGAPAAETPAAITGNDYPPLLILGGHRSGTSLVSGLLWHAGLHMGTLLEAGPDNPRGFFESADVLEAHQGILLSQERDWTCPPHRLDPLTVDLGPLREAAAGLAAPGGPWGVKDPRLLFLLPAWVETVPAMRLIGVVRHPAAVARSLEKRNGFSPEAARAIADAHLGRLAALHRQLRFPLIGYDGPPEDLLARTRAVADALGLAWDEAAAGDLFDPELRHQRPQGPGGADYDALMQSLADDSPPRVYKAWEVAAALADIPDTEGEATPLILGPSFLDRRRRLWEFGSASFPPVGRVLDVVPEGGQREPLLQGVDRSEIDFAELIARGKLRGAHQSAKYTHVLLTGVSEALSYAQLTGLLTWLADATASDAAVVLDALLVNGMRAPRSKRWGRLSVTSARQGPLYHHHVDEIELAALEADWMTADIALNPEGRSRVLLVKQAHRRLPGWVTPSERRAQIDKQTRRIAELEKQSREVLEAQSAEIAKMQDRIRALQDRTKDVAPLKARVEELEAELRASGEWGLGLEEQLREAREQAAQSEASHQEARAQMEASHQGTRAQLERERQRNRLAYDALLKENADIRHMYHEKLGALKEEVRRLRRLRSPKGWLGFQFRRLRPKRVAGALRRRLGSRDG